MARLCGWYFGFGFQTGRAQFEFSWRGDRSDAFFGCGFSDAGSVRSRAPLPRCVPQVARSSGSTRSLRIGLAVGVDDLRCHLRGVVLVIMHHCGSWQLVGVVLAGECRAVSYCRLPPNTRIGVLGCLRRLRCYGVPSSRGILVDMDSNRVARSWCGPAGTAGSDSVGCCVARPCPDVQHDLPRLQRHQAGVDDSDVFPVHGMGFRDSSGHRNDIREVCGVGPVYPNWFALVCV
mmetsp:Transcript_26320/g.59595  ORF Transcript_26320/g.59595 Transcript_26320/m.59595 type:complete len:233 (+) Transcript_26320:662-1360(+)